MKNLKQHLVDACIVVTVTLAMLLGLELAARAASYGKSVFLPAPEVPSTVLKQAWGRQYNLDEGGLRSRHMDYVEVREIAYRSSTITVDEEGRRRVPGNCERADAFTIWMFGGSTMFGYGAPDEFTIPAHLAKILNHDQRCTRIVNYGAGSWQSTQGLIHLIERLKRIRRPEVVIFYDGINDVDNVGDGVPPGGLDRIAKRILSQALSNPESESSILELMARRSVLVTALSKRIFGTTEDPDKGPPLALLADLPGRAKAMAAIYAQNVRLVDLLAREYGFSAYFFLQPYPYISGKKLTPAELAMFEENLKIPRDRDIRRTLYRAFDQEASLKARPRYFDISGIFDGMTDELFADDVHLLPEGNRIVAERIAREIALPPIAK